MKPDLSSLDQYRHPDPDLGGEPGMADGTYRVPYRINTETNEPEIILQLLASELHGFDRVSVTSHESRPHRRSKWFDREPTLKELRFARRLFFSDDETVVFPLNTEGNVKSKAVQMFRAQDVPMPTFGS